MIPTGSRAAPAAPRARRARLAVVLASCGLALAPSSAAAMSAPTPDATLSARLTELARPAVRAESPDAQAARLSLAASGPGSLLRDGNRVLVEAQLDTAPTSTLAALRQAGAEVVAVSDRYRVATLAARPADLPAIGAVPGVAAVSEVLTPIVRGADCGGAVRSEGDTQLGAAAARSGFALDGSGVTIGILSDSFDRDPGAATHAAADVASGDLPGSGSPCGSSAPVSVLDDSEAGADEGRAMAQIVHDLAPGAALSFATAFTGEVGFARAIQALAAAGAGVIVDDVAYFEEPFFQDGPVAAAVNRVVAAGVPYFSAAGNDNLIDGSGRSIASWEAPAFRDSATCSVGLATLPELGAPAHCMDFNPAGGPPDDTFGITVAKGATLTVDLQWAQPWNGVVTDLDAYLLDAGGEPLVVKEGSEEFLVAGRDDNISQQRPVEILQWENQTGAPATVQLAINDCFGACNPGVKTTALPRLKFALLQNGGGVTATEYPQSALGDTVGPTVFGHAGSAAAIAVGAVPYNDSSTAERYSSRGPVTHYFGPVEGASPAPATGAQVISKPDLAATDCGVTTFFASFRKAENAWRFCGTSAAAPHAAAVAALLRQASPGAGPAQVRAALTGTARPVGAFGPTAVGAGLIDAGAAVRSLALPPTIAITRAPAALSRERRPAIEFSANRPVAFSCQVDGGVTQPCASPFVVPAALGDGPHGIVVSGVDLAGREGRSPIASFVIDTKAPRTSIAKHPPKLIITHHRRVRGVFRFRSNEAGVSFVCKVDRGLLRFCPKRLVRRFGAGRHAVRVRARDAAGNLDRTPAVFHFRVKRVG